MEKVKYLIYFLSNFFTFSCLGNLLNNYSNEHLNIYRCEKIVNSDTTIEERILDQIFKLPEVQKKHFFIDSFTKHKRGITLIIMKRPTLIESYYWIQAGYNSNMRFEPYYNFYVYKKNLEIRFYDTETGKVLTIKNWRSKKGVNASKTPVQ